MKKRILLFLLACIMIFSSMTVYANDSTLAESDVASTQNDPVQDFVQRLYNYILDRPADSSGLQAWTDVLKSGKEQGAKVAQGFIESKEFQERNLDDQTYIQILYRTFLNREADSQGLQAWLNVLNSGLSRMHVFKGFAESDEFTEICQNYGIVRGNAVLTAPMDQNEGVTKFIVRCYRLCLGREADTNGLNAWCQQILSGQNTAKEAAYGFIFSSEFLSKNLSNREYVQILYQVFMNREGDSFGLDSWCDVLANGQSRLHVFNGFADSVEFQEICNEYGISSGSGIPIGGSDVSPGNNNSSNSGSNNTNNTANSSVVYYTPNGAKYHSTPDCTSLKRSKHVYSTSIGNAQASGRTPCHICYR